MVTYTLHITYLLTYNVDTRDPIRSNYIKCTSTTKAASKTGNTCIFAMHCAKYIQKK